VTLYPELNVENGFINIANDTVASPKAYANTDFIYCHDRGKVILNPVINKK